MAKQKLYQFLQGEKQGKIVKLSGIENEDNVTYLNFDDGSRCNVEFVAGLNDPRAYSDGKFVAEVYDTTNIWTFDKKVLRDDIRYGTLKDTGEVVQGWDPYTHGKDGTENKAKVTVTAIPPRHVVTKTEMSAGAEKLKALGIDPNTPGYEEGLKSLTIPTQQDLQSKIVGNGLQGGKAYGYENLHSDGTTMQLDSATVKAPSAKDLAPFQRGTEIYIPEDIIEDEQPVSVSNSNNITEKVETIVENRNTMIENQNASDKTSKSSINTSSPIYSIVSKCKKKDVSVPLTLEIKIPSKSIFNLIKDEYEDEAIDEFFDIILEEITTDDIKKTLREALLSSYTQ